MDHKLMCKYINIADSYFKGKNAVTKIINKDPTINGFCNNGVCKTYEAGINALAAYIFKQFKYSIEDHEYNKYDEYLLMWLSDKLFEIHNKSEDKDNKITLNKAYDTYLKNHKVNFNYWILFDNIKGLKEANLKYMSEFYKLLNKICKIITDYEKSPDEIGNLITNSTECSNQYISIYNDIPKCQSYLDLLNKLKGIYDDFRKYAINTTDSSIKLENNLKKFIREDGVEMDAVRGFKSYKFSSSKCKSLDKKITMSKPTEPSGLPRSSEEIPPPQPLKQLKDSQEKTPPEEPSEKLKSPSSSPPLTPSSEMQKQDLTSTPPSPEQSKDQSSAQKDSDGSGNEQDSSDRAPVEEVTQSAPEDPFNTGSFILSVSFQGVEKLNDATTSFETIKKRIAECTDTIKNLY
ncbi:Plasmodium variant antigen protein Cir/Yir/Bir, putative, partial [Plasmodium chabaudi adami]